MIRSIDDSNKYKQPELDSPTSTVLQQLKTSIYILHISKPIKNKLLVMLAINKSTAAKLIVLWNLPALLLLAGAYEVGTTVFT